MVKHRYVAARPLPPAGPRLGPRRYAYHPPVTPHPGLNRALKRLLALLLILLALVLLSAGSLKLWVDWQTTDLIYAPGDTSIPHRHVALVFGAGVRPNGQPSAMLYDRIGTAVELFRNGDVDKLLMTGDNGSVNYNEVEAMRKTAIRLGMSDFDIVLDYAGFSTWDSCYRAREVFDLDEVTIVTQRFHLPRAIFTCRELGVDAVGVIADRQSYPTSYNEIREIPALVVTGLNLLTDKQPKFLGPRVNVDEPQER